MVFVYSEACLGPGEPRRAPSNCSADFLVWGVIFTAVTYRSEAICAQEPSPGAFPAPPHYGIMGHVLSPGTGGGPGLISREQETDKNGRQRQG